MIDLIKVILLGIVEGITEFLPISSTGHLIVAVAILQPAFSPGLENTFEIFIQLGAVIAVVIYYWRDLWARVRAIPSDPAVRRLWLNLIIAAIPIAVAAVFLRSFIKETLFNPIVVAFALIIGGVALILVERRIPATTMDNEKSTDDDLNAITIRQAALIGIAQVLAIIPGVSRSAASIVGGMGAGLNRMTATRFSFYLAIPTLGGATIIDLLLSLDELSSDDALYLLVGAAVAGVIAWLSIGWLLRYVATNRFTGFGIYRIFAGIVILLLAVFFQWQLA